MRIDFAHICRQSACVFRTNNASAAHFFGTSFAARMTLFRTTSALMPFARYFLPLKSAFAHIV